MYRFTFIRARSEERCFLAGVASADDGHIWSMPGTGGNRRAQAYHGKNSTDATSSSWSRAGDQYGSLRLPVARLTRNSRTACSAACTSAAHGLRGMIVLELPAASDQAKEAGLEKRRIEVTMHHPPVAHNRAVEVGPENRSGIVEPSAGTKRVDRWRTTPTAQPVDETCAVPAPAVCPDSGSTVEVTRAIEIYGQSNEQTKPR